MPANNLVTTDDLVAIQQAFADRLDKLDASNAAILASNAELLAALKALSGAPKPAGPLYDFDFTRMSEADLDKSFRRKYRQNNNSLDHLEGNGERQRYWNKCVKLNPADGLIFEAIWEENTIKSGMVSSIFDLDLASKNYRITTVTKMPRGDAVFPCAHWLISGPPGLAEGTFTEKWSAVEIDCAEMVKNWGTDGFGRTFFGVIDKDGKKLAPSYYHPSAPDPKWISYNPPGVDFTADFHEFTTEIIGPFDAKRIVFYCDGVKTAEYLMRWEKADGSPGYPAYLVMNFAVGGDWAEQGPDGKKLAAAPIDPKQFPLRMATRRLTIEEL